MKAIIITIIAALILMIGAVQACTTTNDCISQFPYVYEGKPTSCDVNVNNDAIARTHECVNDICMTMTSAIVPCCPGDNHCGIGNSCNAQTFHCEAIVIQPTAPTHADIANQLQSFFTNIWNWIRNLLHL